MKVLPLIAFVHAFTATLHADAPDFNRDIRPILSANCYACHGPDEEAREADLRLDTFAGATADLGGRSALVPGDPDDSELIFLIHSDDADERMPPPDSGHALTTREKSLLRDWIKAGGNYATHWSFSKPAKPELPPVSDPAWPQNALDHFILAKLDDAGLRPSPKADPAQLLRRLSLDLTGLPPTIAEADAFAADPSPAAHAAAVERLLASPGFGEHWARMWLDLARFADTKGYEKDQPRTIWRYRDWVIDALNTDMPYDEFTLHQLAGDLLPNPTPDQLLATAFHRNTMVNDEGGTDDEEFRVAAVKDRVDTTLQVWMGLTMGCAKCHTHKYDPISIEDYYATYAIFNQTEDRDRADDAPTVPTPTKEQETALAALNQELAAASSALETKPDGYAAAYAAWEAQMRAAAPFWTPLHMQEFTSKAGLTLNQRDDGTLVAKGTRPEDDQWTLTVQAPDTAQAITALRLDILPPSLTGSGWKEDNITIQFSLQLLTPGRDPADIKLLNARASYQQPKWDAAFAVDDNPGNGWALGGGEKEPQVAVFDLAQPLRIPPASSLRLDINFPYKRKLIPSGLRFAVSTLNPTWLGPNVDPMTGWEQDFERFGSPELLTIRKKIAQLESQRNQLLKQVASTPIMRELPEGKRRITRIHLRGNFLDQAETAVTPGIPPAFGTLPPHSPANRAALAEWLCSEDNPLTARVMANRIWARLFGTGIVETEEDFGSQGTYPSHPALLDFLAVHYRENNWSLKSLLRTIVHSNTYQQSSRVTPTFLAADPRNRLLSRGARFRLSAETVRDQALATSGLFTNRIGGPSVFPPQPPGVWKTTYSALKWEEATDEDRYRRALYTFLKRTSPHPAMTAFDAGSGEVCQIRRIRTNTPLQSLVTLNDPAFLEAAGALAARMTEAAEALPDQITHGLQRVLIRKPTQEEVARLVALHASITNDLDEQALLASAGLNSGDPALVVVANVILNLDEALTKP
jgi:hypothetical protein